MWLAGLSWGSLGLSWLVFGPLRLSWALLASLEALLGLSWALLAVQVREKLDSGHKRWPLCDSREGGSIIENCIHKQTTNSIEQREKTTRNKTQTDQNLAKLTHT